MPKMASFEGVINVQNSSRIIPSTTFLLDGELDRWRVR